MVPGKEERASLPLLEPCCEQLIESHVRHMGGMVYKLLRVSQAV